MAAPDLMSLIENHTQQSDPADFKADIASPADWASMYRSLSFQVVPSWSPSETRNWKQPRLSWKGLQQQLVSDEIFDGWFGANGAYVANANMGLLTGSASNNAFILDLDTYKHDEAAAWLTGLLEVHNNGLEIKTPKQITGGGGIQLLFRAPADWTPPTNRTPLGVDIRGRGGFAVLPPSLHSSGHNYVWAVGLAPWEVPIAMAPNWLCSEIDKLLTKSVTSQHHGDRAVPVQVRGDERAEIISPQPASDFNGFGMRINGREAYMTGVVFAAVVSLYRDSPIMPIGPPADDAMMRAYENYEIGVRSRLADGGEKRVLLEKENRGWSLFREKWQRTMVQWNDKIAQAAHIKPEKSGNSLVVFASDRPPAFSDETIALYFALHFADELRYVAARGKWMHYDGTRWHSDETLIAVDFARNVCRLAAGDCDDQRMKRSIASAKAVNAVERLARADRRLAAEIGQWDANPWLLNTPDGVIDLTTGAIREHDPLYYMTKTAAVGPGGACPIWKEHLNRITAGDADLVAYLQRVFGYALTGITREHALFFAYGTGANGKSVTINSVAGILGDYQCTAAIETFTASHTDRHPTELAGLQGARLVTSIETEEGRAWAESKIKSLTGGDPIAARFMRQDFFEYSPQFKLFIAGNHKPALRSVDEAIRRRFHLIPFTVTIPPEDRDGTLTERLKAEWPGIMAWLVEGCIQWQREGLNPPEAVLVATAEYLKAEDAILAWLDEACVRNVQANEAIGTLYASWKVWAELSGEQVGTQKRLSQSLENHGFGRNRTSSTRGFTGLRVKPVQTTRPWSDAA